MTAKRFVRSGELARITGVSTDTVRWYESRGLLPRARRSENGYREYPLVAVDRIHVIQAALAVGFTVAELARIFQARDRGAAPCRDVRQLAGAKLAALEVRLTQLGQLRDDLRATLEDWDRRLELARPGDRAGLLDTLASRTSRHAKEIVLTPPWMKRRINQEKKK
jgi:DNA-binding transcriptional MerR regulator